MTSGKSQEVNLSQQIDSEDVNSQLGMNCIINCAFCLTDGKLQLKYILFPEIRVEMCGVIKCVRVRV